MNILISLLVAIITGIANATVIYIASKNGDLSVVTFILTVTIVIWSFK
jgi:hypothetical protein